MNRQKKRRNRRHPAAKAAAAILLLAALAVPGSAPGNVFAASETTAAAETTEAEGKIAAPKLVGAKVRGTRIVFTWKKVSAAKQYEVYRREGAKGKFKRIKTQKASLGVTYTDAAALAGHTYTYTVRAVGKVNGKTVKSGYDKKGVSATAKVPTVVLGKASAAAGKITVTWTTIPGVTGYRIYRKTTGSYGLVAELHDTGAGSWSDTDVEGGNKYTYTVRAYTVSGDKTTVGAFDKSGVSATAKLAAVTPVSVKSGAGKVKITWTPANGADGYRIFRKTGNGSYRTLTTMAMPTRRYYWDLSTSGGTSYTYAVAPYVKVGSKLVLGDRKEAGRVVALPATPSITSVSASGEQDMITWRPSDGADGYVVYKKNASTRKKWKSVLTLTNGKSARAKVTRDDNATEYSVRAYIKIGRKKYFTPYYDAISNETPNYSSESILFVGDSITYGRLNLGGGNKVRSAVTYPERVARLLGLDTMTGYHNSGYSNSTLAQLRESSTNSAVFRIQKGTISLKDYSVIWIALGTNDYNYNMPMGSPESTSARNFWGGINLIMEKIQTVNPDAKVVFMTPIYRLRLQDDWSKPGYQVQNKRGFTLDDYCNTLKDAAAKYGAYVYDSRTRNVVTAANAEDLLGDGLHPTVEGYTTLAKNIAEYLKKYVLTADSAS